MVEEAERIRQERYLGAGIERSSGTIGQLGTWEGPTLATSGLSIGCVWCPHMARSFAMVGTVIEREGRLITHPGTNRRT